MTGVAAASSDAGQLRLGELRRVTPPRGQVSIPTQAFVLENGAAFRRALPGVMFRG